MRGQDVSPTTIWTRAVLEDVSPAHVDTKAFHSQRKRVVASIDEGQTPNKDDIGSYSSVPAGVSVNLP